MGLEDKELEKEREREGGKEGKKGRKRREQTRRARETERWQREGSPLFTSFDVFPGTQRHHDVPKSE